MRIFIDLENTVIDDIDSQNLLTSNIVKIRQVVEKEKPDCIEIFSFAILNNEDLLKTVSLIQTLSEIFNLPIKVCVVKRNRHGKYFK
jgi:ribosome biogenesis GTPase A